MTRWATLIAVLLAAGPAGAQCLGFQCPPGVLGAGASGAPALPLDGFTQPSGAYSFRKLRSAYAGSAFRIVRASDSAPLDVGFVGFVPGLGAPWDEAAAVAHCAATTCTITIAYDQSGNSRDMPNGTTAPGLTLGGAPNSLSMVRLTAAATALQTAGTFTPATGVVSLSAVARRTSGTGPCTFLRENGAANRINATNGAATWSVIGGGGGTTLAAAAENTWHTIIGVVNGASSLVSIDGTETTGTSTGSTVAGVVQVAGTATTTCDETEWVFWDNYVLTPAQRAAWTANQRSFWGF